MSDAGDIRFTINSNDRASADIAALEKRVISLRAALESLNSSNMRGSSAFADTLTKQLADAQDKLKGLSAGFVSASSAADVSNVRFVTATNNLDAITRATGGLNSGFRAASAGSQVLTSNIKEAITAATGLGRTTQSSASRAKDLAAAFGVVSGAGHAAGAAGKAVGAETAAGAMVAQREVRHLVALFDEFSRGQKGAMAGTFGSMLRDSGLGGQGLLVGIGGLVAAGAVAKLTSDFISFNRELRESAELSKNFSETIGISQNQFSGLSSAMRLVGGDSKDIVVALESVQKRMLEAVKDPQGQVMEAFRRTGFEWQRLRDLLSEPGGSLVVLRQLANAFQQMGGSPGRTATFEQIFDPRQLMKLTPLLREGEEGIAKLTAEGDKFGTVISQQMNDKLEESNKIVHRLDESWLGFKIRVLGSAGMFDGINKELTEIFTQLGSAGGLSEKNKALLEPNILVGGGGGYAKKTQGNIVAEAAIPPISNSNIGAGLQDEFGGKLKNLIEAATAEGTTLGISSGLRSSERQAKLYADAVAKYGSEAEARKWVAPPGHSQHELGKAADLSGDLGFAHRNAARFGLDFPLGNEPWHIEQQGGRAQAPQNGPVDYDEKKAEAQYLSDLKAQQTVAKLHYEWEQVYAIQDKIDKLSNSDADTKRQILLAAGYNKSAAETQLGIERAKTQEGRIQLDHSKAQYDQQTQLAKIDQDLAKLQGQKDSTGAITALESKRAEIIKQFAYSSAADRIQADTRVNQAAQAATEARFRLEEEGYMAQKRANDDIQRGFETRNQRSVKNRQMSPDQAYDSDVQNVRAISAAEDTMLDKLMKIADATNDNTAKTRVYWQEWEHGIQMATKLEQLWEKQAAAIEQANQKALAPLKSFFSGAGDTVENYFEAAITRSQTFAQATRTLLTSVGKDALKGIAGVASESIAGKFGAKAGEGISDLLARKVGSALGLITEVPKNLAEGAAITTAGTAVAAEFTTAITTGGTAAAAEMSVAIAAAGAGNSIGGPIGAAVSSVAILSRGGIIPSAAGGMVAGGGLAGGGQLAILHPNEMVLPSHLSTGLQNMISSGANDNSRSTSNTFNYNANVTGYNPFGSKSAMQGVLRDHGTTLQQWAESRMRGS